jgi:hypothetical protein
MTGIMDFASNSNYDLHVAGPWGLFLKDAKISIILLNGSVALKFVIGQPQRRVSIIPLISGIAAFKKRSHGPALARSKGHN